MTDDTTQDTPPKEEKIEDAEISAYMDRDNQGDEVPTAEEQVAYLMKRYEEVKTEYRRLTMERDEIEGAKRPDLEAALHRAFKNNYMARKYFVKQLRIAGQTVTDKFVPG